MRRFLSLLLFVLGGWMLITELCVAFVAAEPGFVHNLYLIALFGVIAGVPLLLGAWASPGQRWSELGLTILISGGVTLLSLVSVAAILLDPESKPFLPPMPKLEIAPVAGTVNLLLLGALGWFLYRKGRTKESRLEQIFGDG